MTIQTVRAFLMWCFVINSGFLVVWLLMFLAGRDWIYRMHSRWFRLSEERFDSIHYMGMAIYKLAIFLFFGVPFLALLIVG
jgi:hypothetical protein